MIYIADLESNGLTMSDMEITQVAYLKLEENLEIVEEFNKYYYSSNLKDSAEITKLDYNVLASLSGGESMNETELSKILNEFRHGVIIGQNITFDIMALDSISIRYGLGITPKYPLDIIHQYSPKGTLMNLDWICNKHMKPEGKALLEERFKNKEGFHNALYDIYSVYALIKFDEAFKKRLDNYLKSLPRG